MCKECGQKTKDCKDYCIDHLSFMPYASKVLLDIKDREKEEKKILKLKRYTGAIFLKELKEYLQVFGEVTIAKASKDLNVNQQILKKVARDKIFIVSQTFRGSPTVRLKPIDYIIRVWSSQTRRLIAEYEAQALSPDEALYKVKRDFRFNPSDYHWSVMVDIDH